MLRGGCPSIRSMLRRISRRVGRPTAAVMRRTWRFRPSRSCSSSQLVGMLARYRIGGSRSGRGGPSARRKNPRLGWPRSLPLNNHTIPQRFELFRVGQPFHLHPVTPPMTEARIGELLLQKPLIGEKKQTFTVCVEPASCVDLRNLHEIGQASPAAALFRSELAQHSIGLVQQKSYQPAFSRALHRLTTPMEISSSPRSIVRGGRITDCIVSRRGA